MGHIGDEFLAHGLGSFEVVKGVFQLARHAVEGARQNADLVRGIAARFLRKVPRGDALRRLGKALDWRDHGLCQQQAEQNGDEQTHQQRLKDYFKQCGAEGADIRLIVLYIYNV